MASGDLVEKTLTISEFHGVDQSRGVHNADAATSPDSLNFISRYGYLRTTRGARVYKSTPLLPASGKRVFQGFFGTDSVLMASGGGKVFALKNGAWVTLGSGYKSDAWSAVNYRHEETDWIILVNGVDTAKYWDGKTDTLSELKMQQGNETLLFSHISLLYERLWGAVYVNAPDRIYWSESFEPDNWDFNVAVTDTGGGFADVATFDGSSIRAIVAAFDDILIFKDKSMHRLNGTYPGEFNLTQVYGSEGTLASRSIAYTADKLYFLNADGLCVYDGMMVSALALAGDRRLKNLWASLNHDAIDNACAAIYDGVLYLAVPTGDSTENTHVVEYELYSGTYSITTCAGITDWIVWREGQKEDLLCVIGDKICVYDEGVSMLGEPIHAVWTSPEITLGTLASKKQTGRIYMSVYSQSIDQSKTPQIKLAMLSGDKVRERVINLKNGTNIIRKRIKVRGRSFRFRIENVDGNPITINKGMEIALEEDFD